ncbi:MAG TPA: hypothetical protein VMY42_24605 [Thermoguttaceae bacterium]|nr:hypothetical protein [Thermoguttaceae bacterium]
MGIHDVHGQGPEKQSKTEAIERAKREQEERERERREYERQERERKARENREQ